MDQGTDVAQKCKPKDRVNTSGIPVGFRGSTVESLDAAADVPNSGVWDIGNATL